MEELELIYKYYLFNIHYMINVLHYNYKFININDYNDFYYKNITKSQLILNGIHSDNLFVKIFSNQPTDLAKDILKNGMYVPFFGGFTQEKSNILMLGNHRLLSLQDYDKNIAKMNKTFLLIEYPEDLTYFDIKKHQGPVNKEKIYIYDFLESNIRKILVRTKEEYLSLMDLYGGLIGDKIFMLKQKNISFKAPLILNDEQEFIKFINSPYKINEDIIEKQQEEKLIDKYAMVYQNKVIDILLNQKKKPNWGPDPNGVPIKPILCNNKYVKVGMHYSEITNEFYDSPIELKIK